MAKFAHSLARMAELVDALDSNSSSFGVWVRFPLRVQNLLKVARALGPYSADLKRFSLS